MYKNRWYSIKAAQYKGKGIVDIVDIPKPKPSNNEVLVKVKYAGICGSDLEAYKSGLYPAHVVLGHEITGTIAEIGPEVEKWKINEKVSIFPTINCGKCYYCQKGLTNLCVFEDTIGIGKNGGFAEYVLVPVQSLSKLPDSIPDKFGTIFEQIATGLISLRESNFTAGNSAAILGLGTMGQFILQCLKFAGASTIIVVDKNPFRLEVAKKFNPDIAMDKILLPKIKRANRKKVSGLDFVFECTGVPVLVNAAIDIVRKGGTIVQVGLSEKPIEINLLKYVLNQNRIQGIYGYLREDFEFAIELVDRKIINPDPIVTKIISLDDIKEEGFERAIDPTTKDIKILVQP